MYYIFSLSVFLIFLLTPINLNKKDHSIAVKYDGFWQYLQQLKMDFEYLKESQSQRRQRGFLKRTTQNSAQYMVI